MISVAYGPVMACMASKRIVKPPANSFRIAAKSNSDSISVAYSVTGSTTMTERLSNEWVPMVSSGTSLMSAILYDVSAAARFATSFVNDSGAGPPLPALYLMPKSPSGPPGLWLAERMMPPAPCSRIRCDAAGVDSKPPCPTITRVMPLAAAMRMMIWIASRLRKRPSPPTISVASPDSAATSSNACTKFSR